MCHQLLNTTGATDSPCNSKPQDVLFVCLNIMEGVAKNWTYFRLFQCSFQPPRLVVKGSNLTGQFFVIWFCFFEFFFQFLEKNDFLFEFESLESLFTCISSSCKHKGTGKAKIDSFQSSMKGSTQEQQQRSGKTRAPLKSDGVRKNDSSNLPYKHNKFLIVQLIIPCYL